MTSPQPDNPPVISQNLFDILCCGDCEKCCFFIGTGFYPTDITHVGNYSQSEPPVLELREIDCDPIPGKVCILELLNANLKLDALKPWVPFFEMILAVCGFCMLVQDMVEAIEEGTDK